ncbi:hypothetical protein MNBD_GAMMA12-1124 [hydrothermal vent metagenome]|uniref:DUF2007 domain-containing protein n=1 Tax=hydrothermal vent metagenome TaxID=652676 RepID=A0A3B0Y877_9ZZZZ
MIQFYRCENLLEAQQLLEALQQQNIKAEIVNPNLSSLTGEVPFTETWPTVWLVNAEDQHLARSILEDLKKLRQKAHLDILCSQCGEKNPGNFSSCWNCNSDLNSTNE